MGNQYHMNHTSWGCALWVFMSPSPWALHELAYYKSSPKTSVIGSKGCYLYCYYLFKIDFPRLTVLLLLIVRQIQVFYRVVKVAVRVSGQWWACWCHPARLQYDRSLYSRKNIDPLIRDGPGISYFSSSIADTMHVKRLYKSMIIAL